MRDLVAVRPQQRKAQWRCNRSNKRKAAFHGSAHLNKGSKRRTEGDPWAASSLLTIVHRAGIFLRGPGLQVLRWLRPPPPRLPKRSLSCPCREDRTNGRL